MFKSFACRSSPLRSFSAASRYSLLQIKSPLSSLSRNGTWNGVSSWRKAKNASDICAPLFSPTAASSRRLFSTSPATESVVEVTGSQGEGAKETEVKPKSTPAFRMEGRMLIGFDCGVCNTRVNKSMSRDAYYRGAVLIRCDGCQNLHLIADNIDWFTNKGEARNVEEMLKAKGLKLVDARSMGKKVEEIFPKDVLDHSTKKAEQIANARPNSFSSPPPSPSDPPSDPKG